MTIQWKTVGFTTIGVLVALYAVGKTTNSNTQSNISPDAIHAKLSAEVTALNSRTPYKQEGIDGTPQTVRGVIMENKRITYSLSYDDPDTFKGMTEADWYSNGEGIKAMLCTQKTTRWILDQAYTVSYRVYDSKGRWQRDFGPYTASQCK
jgi:hypothetical protein